MRDDYISRRVIELSVMGRMLCWRVAEEAFETAPPNRHIDAEDPVAVKIRFGIPAGVVVDHDCGEGESPILGPSSLGVVEEERVPPSSLRCGIVLTCRKSNDTR